IKQQTSGQLLNAGKSGTAGKAGRQRKGAGRQAAPGQQRGARGFMEDLLHSIPQVMVGDEIVRQVKVLILNGNLKPGQRLPSELALARRLGVSRPSVREALKALEAIGLIERTREGTFVRMDENKLLLEPFSYMVTLEKI